MWPFRTSRAPKQAPASLTDDVWQQTLADHPILTRLDASERTRLRELTAEFMRQKLFESVRGLVLNEPMRASIAVQACLPVLNLGLAWYDDWRTLVIYPAEFVRPREEFDAVGVMHQWEDVLGGESWQRGPVILSWADVEASGWGEGYNVVIHEMAHKLDMHGGTDADGFPPLHKDMKPKDWTAVFTAAYEDLTRRVETGEDAALDAYATESPGEFFAVLSEYFFERPVLLSGLYPEVYRQLASFYRQDPGAALSVSE
ncbi:zinc-dependent peptidase [Methylococcus sp. EFPC2]|uniref:M90 family metallopeptidase n=1 Tax=Methylococcus sp. EFPC2 TaxID=2812648 RepID=UPI001967DC3A|nr:M90 family metallopeptidase [Methylococcus sp. EFPC2]QSA96203.1 zinc-dependent peptidase [Methylococcus sp. EFPC2]